MDRALREEVRRRADDRCEYCRLRQRHLPFSTFHVEHITALKHGGADEANNLALSCSRCNSHKGPNLTGIDPHTGQIVELFNPRRHSWEEHFTVHGPVIAGLTPIGRVTVRVLNMNEPRRVQLRQELMDVGEVL